MKSKLSIPSKLNHVIAFGVHDSNLRLIERLLEVSISPIENNLIIDGKEENISVASNVLQNLIQLSRNNVPISHDEIRIIIEESSKYGNYSLDKIATQGILVSNKGKVIKPRTPNQLSYMKKMLDYDLTFAVGPAGTGKTYLAVAIGLHYLINGLARKLILTRPVLEAGENLGFLPGTMEDKINPYIRPLLDAIYDMLTIDEARQYMESMAIEIAPLAYMRGRTLSNAIVILDEAQNTTSIQMKMFLTRMGENSKMVVTGDISQTDLPGGRHSGLQEAVGLFDGIEEIAFHRFEKGDVVRHDLVKKIIDTYDKKENK